MNHTGHMIHRDGLWVITITQEVKFNSAEDAVLFIEAMRPTITRPQVSGVLDQIRDEIRCTARKASVVVQ